MESDSGLYDDVVATYIRVIGQDSPEAAAAFEEILATCGSRAALRATLVLSLLKMDVEKNHSAENINLHTDLVRDYPKAVPLLERAITCWVQAWTVRHQETLDLVNGNPTSADGEGPVSNPDLPSV